MSIRNWELCSGTHVVTELSSVLYTNFLNYRITD